MSRKFKFSKIHLWKTSVSTCRFKIPDCREIFERARKASVILSRNLLQNKSFQVHYYSAWDAATKLLNVPTLSYLKYNIDIGELTANRTFIFVRIISTAITSGADNRAWSTPAICAAEWAVLQAAHRRAPGCGARIIRLVRSVRARDDSVTEFVLGQTATVFALECMQRTVCNGVKQIFDHHDLEQAITSPFLFTLPIVSDRLKTVVFVTLVRVKRVWKRS